MEIPKDFHNFHNFPWISTGLHQAHVSIVWCWKFYICAISLLFAITPWSSVILPVLEMAKLRHTEDWWAAAPDFEPGRPASQENLKPLHRWLAEEPRCWSKLRWGLKRAGAQFWYRFPYSPGVIRFPRRFSSKLPAFPTLPVLKAPCDALVL